MNIEEEWKDIKGFECCYQISNCGVVKSLTRYRNSSRGSVSILQGRILKLKTSKSGYLCCHLRRDELSKHPSVHRLVAEAFIPNHDNKPTVNHKDGNKQNNRVDNLEWATHSEQMVHAVDNELVEVRGSPKYSKAMKKEMLEYYSNNSISITELSKVFGVSERTAGRIANDGVNPRPTTRVLKSGEVIVEDILSKEQVAEIKRLRAEGWTFKRLGEKFNRGLSQMHRVVNDLSRTTNIE